jgi:hypothetical protein
VNRLKNLLRGYSPFTTDAFPSASATPPATTTPPPHARLTRLSHALIAKSIVEALFVVALAVHFSYDNINPYFRGSIDVADARTIEGWVVNEAEPEARVELHLYIDDHFVGSRRADAPRADVLAAGRSRDAYHGFVFNTPPLPPDRTYRARVYAMHIAGDGTRRVLQEIGAATAFSVTADRDNLRVPDAWRESEGQQR